MSVKIARGCKRLLEALNILQVGIWAIAMRLFVKITALPLEENFAERVNGISIASVISRLDSVHAP